jgi:hypothetical protein
MAEEYSLVLLTIGAGKVVSDADEKKPVGTRWAYTVNTDSAGFVTRFKARLVAPGFSQKPMIDYDNMVAPVMRLEHVFFTVVRRPERSEPAVDVGCCADAY